GHVEVPDDRRLRDMRGHAPFVLRILRACGCGRNGRQHRRRAQEPIDPFHCFLLLVPANGNRFQLHFHRTDDIADGAFRAGLDEYFADDALDLGFDDHRRLLRLHLRQRHARGDPVAGLHMQRDDIHFLGGHAHLRDLHLDQRHASLSASSAAVLPAAAMPRRQALSRSPDGTTSRSSAGLNGTGTVARAIRFTGIFSASNQCSAISAASSAANPQTRLESSRITTLPVLRTAASSPSRWSGSSVLGSKTWTEMPSPSSSSATSSASRTRWPTAMTVTPSPSLRTAPFPSGISYSASSTSPRSAMTAAGANSATGSSQRTAATSNPLASAGVEGMTTFMPACSR